MDHRQLRHFLAIYENGSLTAASNRLGLTVSALSKSLQNLETDLGVSLLTRGPGGMMPTPYGEALSAHARMSGNVLEQARRSVEELRDGIAGTLAVGTSPGAAQTLLPAAMAQLRKSHPGIRVIVREGLFEVADGVMTGDLDFALVAPDVHALSSGFAREMLVQERVVVVGDAAAFRQQKVRLNDLAEHDWVLPVHPNPLRVRFESTFTDAGQRMPQIVAESGSVSFIKALVEASDILTYLPEHLVGEEVSRGELVVLDCAPLEWSRGLGMIWHAARPLPPAADPLMSALRAAAATLRPLSNGRAAIPRA